MPQILLLLFVLILGGCTSVDNQPITPTPLPTGTSVSPTFAATPPPSSTPSPTPTNTSSPTPSLTPTRTLIPTPTDTPQPVAISASNASQLILEVVYDLPLRGQLVNASWSKDGQLVLVTTSLGTYLLDDTLANQIHFYPDLTPIQEFEDGDWLVQAAEGRQTLSLDGENHHLVPNRDPIYAQEGILLSANGEIAVRMLGQEEFEVIEISTGEIRAFNFPNAGYYFKYIDLGSISPDGKQFAVRGSTAFSSSYIYFDSDSLRVIAEFPNLYAPPLFSPDSQTILIRDRGGYKVLKTSNGIQNNRFSDGFGVRSSSGAWMYYQSGARTYHPDNQRVGVIYFPHAGKCDLYLWSLATGYPESIFKGLPEGIMGIDFSNDGKRLVTVSQAGIVQTWDLDSQTLLNESIPFDRTEPVVSQDGNLAAVLRFNQVEVIDIHSGEVLQPIGDYPLTYELSVDSITAGHLLVAANPNYRETIVDLWDLSTGTLVRQFKPLSHLYTYSNNTFCTFAWQGDRIMCGSMPIQVFDINSGRLLMSYRNTEVSTMMAISTNGSSLASCKSDRIFLLDPADTSSTINMVLEAGEKGICSKMIFSPDNRYLAAQSGYIWQIDQALPVASFSPGWNRPMAFNSDSSLLIVNNQVIHTSTGDIVKELDVGGQILMVGFDQDEHRLFVYADNKVMFWKVGSPQ